MTLISRVFLPVIFFALTAGLSACNSDDKQNNAPDPSIGTAAEVITISDPRIRATPPSQPVTGAFMTLTNTSGTAFSLVAAQSDMAQVTELHETSMDGEMMKMQKVEQIDIPANGSVELKPGSFHVMLIQLNKPAVEGSTESITLQFSDNSQTTVEAPVANITK